MAALRARLVARGVAAAQLEGVWGASTYDPDLVLARVDRAQADVEWPEAAWLVGTPAGCWFVWNYGVAVPADRAALELERRTAGAADE